MKTDSYKNTESYPLDLDDGSQVAPGDRKKIEDPGPVATAHIEAGRLVASSSGTSDGSSPFDPSEGAVPGGEPTSSKKKKDAKSGSDS